MRKPDHVLEVFLQPGDFHFGDADTRIRTLLGSCVSITLWHPRLLIGGMCHYMLPERPHGHQKELDGRYAEDAMQMFLREIRAAKTPPADYVVKMFGAGDMFPLIKRQHGTLHAKAGPQAGVPEKNRAAAYALVEKYGFKVHAEDLGGEGHRQILFDIWSGHAWVKKPPAPAADAKGKR